MSRRGRPTPTNHGDRHVAGGPDEIPGIGGGTMNHAALTSNLAWTSSGHTGTANAVPVFSGAGAAAVVTTPTLPADGWLLGTSSSAPAWVREGVPNAGFQRWGTWMPDANTDAAPGNGVTTSGSVSNTIDTVRAWLQLSSATLAEGHTTTYALVRTSHNPILYFCFRTGSAVTSVRYFVGWGSATSLSADAGAANHAGLQFSTGTGDANLYISAKDGTTQSRTDTGVVFSANTVYQGYIRLTATHIYVSINGGAEVSHNTNLPANTVNLGWQLGMATIGGPGTRTWELGGLFWRTRI